MTPREQANQMADEDEGKGANLKEKSSSEKSLAILKDSSLRWQFKLTLFILRAIREENCPSKNSWS